MDRVSDWYKPASISPSPLKRRSLAPRLVAAAQEAVKQETATNAGSKEVITANIQELNGLGLNVGWHLATCKDCPQTIAANIADHCVGWLLTALACSLGAPFWFDLLNKFMVVRSTIKPSEKSQDEISKDPHG